MIMMQNSRNCRSSAIFLHHSCITTTGSTSTVTTTSHTGISVGVLASTTSTTGTVVVLDSLESRLPVLLSLYFAAVLPVVLLQDSLDRYTVTVTVVQS
jgi:hypothetical protein